LKRISCLVLCTRTGPRGLPSNRKNLSQYPRPIDLLKTPLRGYLPLQNQGQPLATEAAVLGDLERMALIPDLGDRCTVWAVTINR
jgi:hypothetical protein